MHGLLVAAVAVSLLAGCSADPAAPPPSPQRTAATPPSPQGTAATPPPTSPASNQQPPTSAPAKPPAPTLAQLPRGGRTLLPKWRIVAYYGWAHGPALGVLGSAAPDAIFPRLNAEAVRFATPGHPVLPAYELIVTVANAGPGPDGKYRTREDPAQIQRYLDSARRHKALLVLDIQPGRADFMTEARVLERWLRQPDVALAIDPEWRMGPGEVPGRTIGSVGAAEVNTVSGWLDALTAKYRLPQKLLLVHQFTNNMVTEKPRLLPRRNVPMVFNMDGFGAREDKLVKYRMLAADRRFGLGLKLFYKQDIGRFAARDVVRLSPVPSIVEYQ